MSQFLELCVPSMPMIDLPINYFTYQDKPQSEDFILFYLS
jgi:hypothetical protein